jgi:PhzF family phenazine biosynthesis protein
MPVEAAVVSAFVENGRGGNLAGVVLDAEELPDERRQDIARALGFSETAFIEKSGKADFKVRFFTPSCEVDLCGHATIASFAYLFEKKRVGQGAYTQETKAGVLPIEVWPDGTVFMDQTLPEFGEAVFAGDAEAALRARSGSVVGAPRVVSTGIPDLLVELERHEDLLALKPDFIKVAALSKKAGAGGVHVYTLDAHGATAACRNFAPLFGIDEESATGTASGALACHLVDLGKAAGHMIFAQGESLGRRSRIMARPSARDGLVTRVQVGGKAVVEKLASV